MTPQASTARSGYKKSHLWFKILAGWILLTTACSLPANPFSTSSPFTDSTEPAATITPPILPTPIPQIPPILVETNPLPGSQVDLATGLTLYFSQPMDRASVETALVTEPILSGEFKWQDDATLQFLPETFPTEQTFHISLGSDARAQNGLALASQPALTYQSPGELELVEFQPANNARDVNSSAAVVATFNQPVVPLSAEERAAPPAFSIQPDIAGRGEWINTSTYVFYPEPALPGGVDYTVAINPNLTATTGAALQQPFLWRFRTVSPRLEYFNPPENTEIGLEDSFEMVFNQPMDTASVEELFNLMDARGNTVSGIFEWSQQNRRFVFTPDAPLTRASVYTLHLPADTQALGGAGLGTAVSARYTTFRQLAVTGMNPKAGEPIWSYSGYGSFSLNFNAELESEDIAKHFSIDPPVGELTVRLDHTGKTVWINGIMPLSTTYTLTISEDLRDKWGRSMGEDANLTFFTDAAQPNLNVPLLTTYYPRLLFALPEDVTLLAEATNLSRLDISAAAIDPQEALAHLDWDREFTVPQERWQLWQQPLDLPRDQPHSVTVPLSLDGASRAPGLYLVEVTAPEFPNKDTEQTQKFVTVVSRIQLMMKSSSTQVFIWAIDLTTNQPVEGLPVSILDENGEEAGSLLTGADGTGSTSLAERAYGRMLFALSGAPGEPNFSFTPSNWSRGINHWDFSLPSGWEDSRFGYAYTDRPIYMPGDTVYFRANVHHKDNGRYLPSEQEQVAVKIFSDYSVLDDQQSLLADLMLDVSPFGVVTGEYQLQENAVPGTYMIRFPEFPNHYLYFKVAQYRKPEIDLQASFNAQTYLPGDEIVLTADARYYFGAPASEQPIRWSVWAVDEPIYLPGGYRTGALNLDKAYRWDQGYGEGYSGTGEWDWTDENGQFVYRLSDSELEKLLSSGNPRRLNAQVTHMMEVERPVSVSTGALLYPADFLIGVRSENYSGRAGQETAFSILTTDLDQKPTASPPLQARFQKVTWEEAEDDRAYLRVSKPVFTDIASTDFQTGPDGRARLAFTPDNPGLYQLEVTGGDAITQVLLWTGGESDAAWPRLPDQHILLQADQPDYSPGETARVFVPNPYGAGAQVLVTVERSRVMRSELLTAQGNSVELSIPIQPEDAPNVYVGVTLIGSTRGGRPDFRSGYVELTVDPAAQILDVALVGSPEQSEPGGEVTFTIAVQDSAGQPVQGEFSLALVDKAVLALAQPNSQSIVAAYYGRQPLGVFTSLGLAAYNRRLDMTSPDADGRGGGGESEGFAIREQFEDTAFWEGNIITGADGRAEVTVSLPDNLTTWVALVRGLDRDARVGEAEIELVTTKALLVRPQAPRFLVAGDHATLGAHVHNNTAEELEVTVRLDAAGFELDRPGQAVQEYTIPAGGQVYVTWSGTAQAVETIDLVFSARGGDLRDAVRPEGSPLPVLRYRTPQTYGTSGTLTEAGERLEVIALPRTFTPEGGSLRVELSPSLAAALLEELQVREMYSINFTEAVLSRFLPNVQALQALRGLGYSSPELESRLESEITEGIAALQRMQNEDGGWGIRTGAESSTHITAYVLFGLAHAQAGGQNVDGQVLELAKAYLLTNMKVPDASTQPAELDRLAFQNFALQQAGVQDPGLERLSNFYEDMSPWAQGLLALTIAGNDPQDDRPRQIIMGIKDAVRRSATGVHWEGRNDAPELYSTPTYNNAVVVYTLAKLDPATPMLPEAARYLLASRRGGGSWNSSYETAWSLLALTQTLMGTADVQANYAYSAALDRQELVSGQAAPGALQAVEVEVGLDRLRQGTGSELRIQRGEGSGRLYYRSFLQIYSAAEEAQPVAKGVYVERRYYADGQDCRQETCEPQEIFDLDADRRVLVRLTITVPESMHYLVVEDFIPAGAEIYDTSLLTTTRYVEEGQEYLPQNPFSEGWNSWIFGSPVIYSDRAWWIAEEVPPGTYELVYYLQPLFEGAFRALPAHAYQYYFPDVEGSSGGSVIRFEREK
jgi:alpha-2-macroglobulin